MTLNGHTKQNLQLTEEERVGERLSSGAEGDSKATQKNSTINNIMFQVDYPHPLIIITTPTNNESLPERLVAVEIKTGGTDRSGLGVSDKVCYY